MLTDCSLIVSTKQCLLLLTAHLCVAEDQQKSSGSNSCSYRTIVLMHTVFQTIVFTYVLKYDRLIDENKFTHKQAV